MTTRHSATDWGHRSQFSAKPIEKRAGFRINHAVAIKVYDRRRPGKPIPAIVLDPFGGAGTTALAANRNGRNAILCELSPAYADMARRRLVNDLGMLADVTVMDGQEAA